MHGILLIDKPKGITSHDVVRRVRRLLKTRRVGHTGTLDPMATGVLPVAVGEGTRLVQFLLEGDKEYQATLKLGIMTETQDAEGRVIEERALGLITPADVLQGAARLTGDILQLPPMFSALKKDGIPLHRLARQGIEVERSTRPVTIYRLTVTRIDFPEVDFTVACSKGTYVRTLAHDLGMALGCGAHLTALRRTRSGPFHEGECLPLATLEDLSQDSIPRLLGPREVLPQMATLEINATAALRLKQGIPPALDQCLGLPGADGDLILLLDEGKTLSIATFAPHREREKRGDFELLRVFNHPGIW